MPGSGSGGPQTSAHTIMDEADFSEDTTCKQQDDLPYDGVFPQMKMRGSYNLTPTNNTPAVSEDIVLSGEDPQEKSTCCKMCQNTAVVGTSDKITKITENVVNHRRDKDKQCTLASCVPAKPGDASKSHISDSLPHQLSREQSLTGQSIGCETLPGTMNADRLDDAAILTSVTLCHGKNYCPKEQSPEFTDQASSKSGAENRTKSNLSPGTAGESTPPLGSPVTAGQSHQEDPSFLSRTKGPGVESVKCPLKLTPTTQRDPSPDSYIFQKISQGKQMCQKLKEQTDQLKTKVQEFSKRIKQDSLCHLQDIRLMTKEHTGCVPGRRREVTGLPDAGPQEVTSKELSELAPKMKQKKEKGGHKRTNCGKFSSSTHEKTLRHDSPLGSDPGPSFHPDSSTGLQSDKGEDSDNESQNSQRVCSEEPPKEFHYRYDTPGQDDLKNHNGGYTSAQSHFLHENKMSSSSCSTSKCICSPRVNSEPYRDEQDSSRGKHSEIYLTCNTDPATPSTHLRFLRIPGIQSLCDCDSMEETESK
ncbi:hypothetical protein STEG23_003532, partial [Scotinomys teguina]